MTPRHSSRLTTHLGAIALALAASQAGATTYSVPLQFTLNLAAPVCSLTVGGVTADATTPTPATSTTVNLTPAPLSAISSPNSLAASIPGTSAFSANAAGLSYDAALAVNRKLDTPPTASVTCTSGTPMVARLAKVSPGLITVGGVGNTYNGGTAGSGQTVGVLPVGMALGMANFAGTAGASGSATTTLNSSNPSLSATANGSAQPLVLTASFHSNSTTPLTTSHAGLWTYSFSVNLDF